MQSAVFAIVNPSVRLFVRPSVRHTLALSQNDSSSMFPLSCAAARPRSW